jgi:hypothetical protein
VNPFATPDDVASIWRPLTPEEETAATTLLEVASAIIRSRFPGIDSEVTTGAVPAENVRFVCAGMVKRALIAPDDGVSQESSTTGPYSAAQTFANPLRNVFLTAADLILIQGYRPSGGSFSYGNTTIRRSQCWGYDGGITVIPSNPGI